MSIPTAELCARYRRLYVPAVCDALYWMGLPEQVLPSYLRPLFPEQRIAGIAYTIQGGNPSIRTGSAGIRASSGSRPTWRCSRT